AASGPAAGPEHLRVDLHDAAAGEEAGHAGGRLLDLPELDRDRPRPWPEWPDVVGLADMPTQDGGGTGTVTLAGGWGLSIPRHVTDREVAFSFLEKLVST